MTKISFTEARVRDLKPSDKIAWYSHKGDAYPGLHLAVGQTVKTWYLKKRNPTTGKTQTVNLGRYPAMSLELAAKRAKDTASEIHNGTRGAVKMETLRDAFEFHCRTKRDADALSADTEKSYRSIMKRMDDFMDTRLENISHAALQTHLGTMPAATARLIKAIVSASYRAAKRQRRTLDNPAEGIQLKAVRRRDTELPITELHRAWQEIEAIKSETKRMAWVVNVFTGIRHKSIVTLRWTPDPLRERGHVDLDNRLIHLPKMKNRLARDIPICDFVVKALEAQRGKDAVFVFPSDKKEGVPLYSMGRLSEGLGVAHDMRGHFVTAAARCELPSYVIEYLKGDKLSADGAKMVAHYLGSVGSHGHVERISAELRRHCGLLPDSDLAKVSKVA